MARGRNRGQWLHTQEVASRINGEWHDFPDGTIVTERETITDPARAAAILGGLAGQKAG